MEVYKPGISELRKCYVCGCVKECCQHHLIPGSGRKTSLVIWVCMFNGYIPGCHDKIHNPSAYGLPPRWAYKNGFISKGDGIIKKLVKRSINWKLKKTVRSQSYWKINLNKNKKK